MPVQTLPTGRLVYGHPSKLVQKTDTKRQPVIKDGKPVMVRQFGVAYTKDVFGAQIWPIMYAAASGAFGGQQPPPHFSYKFKDGDTVDRQGRPYSQREGYAGHCVIHFETQFDLIAYRHNPQTNGWDQITENDYKTGDYIQVNASIEGNKPSDPTHTPGLFINPQGVLHIANGTAIVNAPSADQMFGGVASGPLPPGALPPGSASPVPAGAPNPPGFAGGAAPVQQPVPGYGAPPAPGYHAPQLATPPGPGGYAPAPAAPAAPAAQPVYQQPPVAAAPVPGQPAYPPATGFVAGVTGQPDPNAAPVYAQPQPGQPVYAQPGQPPAAPVYQQPQPGAPAGYPLPGQPPHQ